MSPFLRSLGIGARQLVAQPGASLLAVTCLALGIGCATAVLAIVEGVLGRPLPYPSSERIVTVWETPPGTLRNPVSGPNFFDWKRQSRSFGALAAVAVQAFNLSGVSEPELVCGARVSASFFEVFGTPLALGRAPRPEESSTRVAVVSDRLWRQRLASRPDALGSEIRIDGEAHTVIGVLAPGLEPGTMWSLGQRMDVWVPFEPSSAPEHRSWHSMEVVGRLADGVSLQRAQAEMTAIAADLEARYPDSNHGYGARVATLHAELVGRGRIPLLLLLAAATLVLLLACANVAGLLLARTSARGAELAVRATLGAGSRRLAAQLLTEVAPLVAISGALALAATSWGLPALRAFLPSRAWQVPELAADGRLVGLCAGLTVLVWALVGTPLALLAPRRDVAAWLRSGRGEAGTAPGHRRLRGGLVVAQLAIGLVLANAAVLLLTSFGRLLATDQGFDQEHVLTARLQLVGPRYQGEGKVAAFLRELEPRLRGLPGVREAALTTKLPLYGGNNGNEIIEGREGDFGRDGGPEVERSTVSPGYFRAMGIPLLEGRLLTEDDTEAPVAVINRTFASLGWPGQSPLGRRFRSDAQWFTVVGVVADVRQWGPERPARPELYRLFAAAPRYESEDVVAARPYVLLRTASEPLGMAGALRRAVQALDGEQPVSEVSTMRHRVEQASAGRRFLTTLLTGLAGVALLLVATGLYGLMSTIVVQRTHELGVRMAVGADAPGVVRLVLRKAFGMTLGGVVVGLVGVVATTPLLASQLYDARATDPLLFGVGTVLVVLTALAGAAVPAWRASRVCPTVALRAE